VNENSNVSSNDDGYMTETSGGLTPPLEKKMSYVSLREMLQEGVHFGHQTRYWEPKMAPYIFGTNRSIHIIDLEQTQRLFDEALNAISRIVSNRGKVLFVGTKYAAQDVIREMAESCGMPYVNHRWLGGMLTNYKTIRQQIRRLNDLIRMSIDGTLKHLTKKEGLTIIREQEKLERSLGGIKEMGGLPDALFIIDVGHEEIAVKEAKRLGIPVFGIVDTNNSPDDIDYIIPGNDDATRAIRLYCGKVAAVINEAKEALQLAQGGPTKDEPAEAAPVAKTAAAPAADVDVPAEKE
jgi:small subunit ribosomal protein S2